MRIDENGTLKYDKVNLDVALQNVNSAANVSLRPKDKLIIKSQKRFIDEYEIAIQGAVRNPSSYKYDQGNQLKINDLVTLADGLTEDATDFAYVYRKDLVKSKERAYLKINLKNAMENPDSEDNITLKPNDRVQVFSVFKYIDEFEVGIGGAVREPINLPFDASKQLQVNDLVLLSGGLREDATDFAYVYRKTLTNSKEREYIRIDLKNASENPSSGDNITLMPHDKVQVFSIYDYMDSYEISVKGAVRKPSTYASDATQQLRIDDLVLLSGGLKVDATDFAYVYRRNPINIKEKQYIRINIKNAIENPSSPDNLILEPNDELQVLSKESYTDDFFVNVGGAVRVPGKYKFDVSLTLKDVLTLSQGLTLSASSNRIDIFRMIINRNEVTKTIVATVEVDDNLEIVSKNAFKLEPFDHIIVRDVPEFELQRFIRVEGEVKYPGEYALLDNNEKITSIIKRAGGFSGEAFTEGATLFRPEDGTGYIVLRLDQAMRNKKNRHNFILKEGDVISVPKRKDIVTVTGATKAKELYPSEVVGSGKLNVAYKSGKRAKWYIDEYAAGIGENGKKRLITVEHPNGEIKRTKRFLFFKISPKVRKGSVVTVGVKPPKPAGSSSKKEREKVDWGRVLADSVAQATAVLSLILLLQRID